MALKTPIINIMTKAAYKAGNILIKDFREVENLQVSKKGIGDFVTSTDVNSEKVIIKTLQKAYPDIKILSEEILRIPKFGFINIHASLLPKWRGAAPIQRAIMARDSETGISIMKMTKNLDTGPVMLKSKIKLNANTNAEELSKSLMMLSSREILNALREINCGKAVFKNQNHKEATYAKKR